MEYSNELAHHGIKGQKWGIRRYQNEDGTLTEEGKKRYGNYSEDALRAETLKSKRVEEMSDAELKELNNRQQLEKTHQQLNPSAIKRGAAYVAGAAGIMATAITFYNNSNKLIDIGTKGAEVALQALDAARVAQKNGRQAKWVM